MKKFCKSVILNSAKNAHFKRGLALAVAASVAFTSADFTAMAVSDVAEIDPIEIASFDDLASDVAYQQLSVGASESDIVFPNTLKAKKSNAEDNFIEEIGEEEVIDGADEAQNGGDNSSESGSSDIDADIFETPVIEEENPSDDAQDITVEEENIVARILGGFFNNIFDGLTTTAYAAESEEINITNVEWILSEDLSDKTKFEADEQWLRYTYVPEIPSCYVTDAELPKITVDIIGTEVQDEIRTDDEEFELELLEDDSEEVADDEAKKNADSDDEADFTEEAEYEALAPEGEYDYTSKSGETKLISSLLKETNKDGSATPVIETEDLTAVEISDVTPADDAAEYFEVKKYKVTSEGELDKTSGDYVEDPDGQFTIHVLKAFSDPHKLTVTLKDKTTTSDSSEAKTYTYQIFISADASAEENVKVTVADKYIYNGSEQELVPTDVTVTKGEEPGTAIPATDYDVEPIKKTDAGKYSFKVTFKNDSATLVQATGEWEIKPAKVKVTADNQISVKGQALATCTYKVEVLDTEVKDKLGTITTIDGVTAGFETTTPSTASTGAYDINILGENKNFDITEVDGRYFIIDFKLTLKDKSGEAISDLSKIPEGTTYTVASSILSSKGVTLDVDKTKYAIVYLDSTGKEISKPSKVGTYKVYAKILVNYAAEKDADGNPGEHKTFENGNLVSAETSFTIVESEAKSLKDSVASATLTTSKYTYTGNTINVLSSVSNLVVKYGSTKLTKDTHYTISGTTSATEAGTYAITVTGVTSGGYKDSILVTWDIVEKSIASATIPSSTKVTYSYTGNEIEHDVPSTISLSGYGTLRLDEDYEVDESKSTTSATKAGTYTVYLTGIDNFTGTKSYQWKISSSSSSTTTGKVNSTVNFSNPDNIQSSVTTANSSKFEAYANSKKTSGKTLDFTLKIKPIAKSNLSSSELNAIAEFGDESVVTTDSLDVTVHKVVKDSNGNTESEEDVSDLGGSIDVVCYVGTTNSAKTINIIREHGGTVKKFSKLSSRPSSSYSDGTFYVDKSNGRVYIYSRYFSRFTLIYTETDAVVKNTRTSSGTATSESPDSLGARAPQTGDNLPVVWVWVIVLLAGVGLIGFSAFELKKFKRGDFKKKR